MNRTGLSRLVVNAAQCALLALVFAHGAQASTDLQLSYGVGPKPAQAAVEPVARASADFDTPLHLERELIVHIDRMTRTTLELRAIVEAMPGPGIAEPTPTQPQSFPSPLEETIARLNHVEQLIVDIGQIIKAMPMNNGIAPPKAAPEIKPAKPQAPPAPSPAPDSAQDEPLAATTKRTLWLLSGGLVAAMVARYLRRRYLRKRPSTKELAASIEPPPLKDEAIELADVMTSMGLADGAAQALVERIRANPRQSLSHWLKLLEVYRQTGQQQQFEKATEEMRKTFNVKPADWDDDGDGHTRNTSLENYPHIATQLKKLWPDPACSEYLLSLLADNREGKRAGFPLPVIEEIVLLLAVLRSQE